MNSNLSPDQFIQQHVDFERWTHDEEHRLTKEHEVSPGHSSFPRDVGRKMAALRGVRQFLTDTYSEAAHEAIHTKQPFDKSWVGGPLREVVDERYHPLVDEYENRAERGTA